MRWIEEIENSIRTVEQLQEYFDYSDDEREKIRTIINRFPMQITPYYFNLINFNDPDDPIKNIIVPRLEELSNGGSYDTSGEAISTKIKGLQHKYTNTALVLLDNVCASYCRFCFRKRLMNRNLPSREILSEFDLAYQYIASHPEIDNVLISGGDPFMFNNEKIDYILNKLRELKHIKIIRIGTRMPAFLPYRFTEDKELLDILSRYNLPDRRLYIVTHFDHPRELTSQAIEAIDAIKSRGIVICNQTVLLKGINDDPLFIRKLFNNLASCGVEPYYLFQCRPVKSSLHSQLSLEEGYSIFEEAKEGMGGLAKRARYIMSHFLGKIEILHIEEEDSCIIGHFKFHQARYPRDYGRFFTIELPYGTCWLDRERLEEHLSVDFCELEDKASYTRTENNFN